MSNVLIWFGLFIVLYIVTRHGRVCHLRNVSPKAWIALQIAFFSAPRHTTQNVLWIAYILTVSPFGLTDTRSIWLHSSSTPLYRYIWFDDIISGALVGRQRVRNDINSINRRVLLLLWGMMYAHRWLAKLLTASAPQLQSSAMKLYRSCCCCCCCHYCCYCCSLPPRLAARLQRAPAKILIYICACVGVCVCVLARARAPSFTILTRA